MNINCQKEFNCQYIIKLKRQFFFYHSIPFQDASPRQQASQRRNTWRGEHRRLPGHVQGTVWSAGAAAELLHDVRGMKLFLKIS